MSRVIFTHFCRQIHKCARIGGKADPGNSIIFTYFRRTINKWKIVLLSFWSGKRFHIYLTDFSSSVSVKYFSPLCSTMKTSPKTIKSWRIKKRRSIAPIHFISVAWCRQSGLFVSKFCFTSNLQSCLNMRSKIQKITSKWGSVRPENFHPYAHIAKYGQTQFFRHPIAMKDITNRCA